MIGTMTTKEWITSASSGTLSSYVDSTLYTVIDSFRCFVMLHKEKDLKIDDYVSQWNEFTAQQEKSK